jgi:hypothetical protein
VGQFLGSVRTGLGFIEKRTEFSAAGLDDGDMVLKRLYKEISGVVPLLGSGIKGVTCGKKVHKGRKALPGLLKKVQNLWNTG